MKLLLLCAALLSACASNDATNITCDNCVSADVMPTCEPAAIEAAAEKEG
jgi:hypothetical protein